MRPEQTRTYDRANSVVFLKTDEPFGGLSNMAGGFPLWVNGTRILTSEALYQACRFPHRPEVQALIIEQRSPMTAKMKSKPYRQDSRPDWDRVRVKIMRWCLRVKLAQNWRAFSELLLETGERPIVEESRKDAFWGAKATEDGTLVGMNVLGRLLMQLREVVKVEGREPLMSVQPLAIPDFLLGGRPIEIVVANVPEHCDEPGKAIVAPDRAYADGRAFRQSSLFEEPAVKEAPIAVYSAFRAKSVHVADLKPYAEYKESGLPWLGQVPRHWETRRAKFLLREVDSRSRTGSEQLLRVSQYTGVTQRKALDGSESPDTRAASLVGYKRVQPNDLVINIMLAWNGSMGVSRYDGITSPAYCVYRFNENAMPWYFHELLRTPAYKQRIKTASTGVVESRLRLYSDDLGRLELPLPPVDEQAAIVRFLDWAGGRLERAIRAKRKVIALLNEQKQAIIHRAVTRGLDPAVPLKSSGIPWLGDIPQHWEVRRLRTLVHHIDQGISPLAVGFLAEGDSWGVLKSGCVNRGVFRETEHKQLARNFEIDPSIVVKVGDVLISRACGSPTLVGSVGRVKSLRYKLILSDKTFRARFHDRVDVDFMVFAMNCRYYRHQVEQAISGAEGMANNLPLSSLRNFSFAIPPADEAAAIAGYLESETAEVERAISRLEREIELLREYRTRLVADVVTGKLDVREAALLLPDEAPLDAIEDDADLGDETENEAEGIEA